MLNIGVARRAGLCAAAAMAVACTRDLDAPAPTAPRVTAHHLAGVVAITFRNIGRPNMTPAAIVGSSVAEVEATRAAQLHPGGARLNLTVPKNTDGSGNATIQLALEAAGASTVDGTRFFDATYRVRNAQKTDSAA